MTCPIFMGSLLPLTADEVVVCFKERWGVTYDLILVTRNRELYLQVMWAYLEQQSFPLDKDTYLLNLNKVLEVINRLGQSEIVRGWLATTRGKPRVGRPLILHLKGSCLEEFVL